MLRQHACFRLLLCLALLLALPSQAQAQPLAKRRAEAAKLADKGFDKMQRGDYTEAASLFYEADKLFHSPVFIVFAARAEEKGGDLVKAHKLLDKVSREKLADYAPDAFRKAQKDARKALAELDKRVPRTVITVSSETAERVDVSDVELDGKSVGSAQLDVPVRVNPGDHRVVVTTEDGREQSESFSVGEGERKTVSLIFEGGSVTGPTDPDAGGGSIDRYVPAIIAFSVAGGAALVWAGTGIAFINQSNELKRACEGYGTDPLLCPPDQQDARDQVTALGNASTAFAVITGLGVAAGVVLAVVPIGGGDGDDGDEEEDDAPLEVRIAPQGVSLVGRF